MMGFYFPLPIRLSLMACWVKGAQAGAITFTELAFSIHAKTLNLPAVQHRHATEAKIGVWTNCGKSVYMCKCGYKWGGQIDKPPIPPPPTFPTIPSLPSSAEEEKGMDEKRAEQMQLFMSCFRI